MQRSETKSNAKQQKNVIDVDKILPKILAMRTSIAEASEHSTSNKKPVTPKDSVTEKLCHQNEVFTKKQEVALRKHIIKCCQTQYYRNTTLRKMIYEYAQKLPDCHYPKRWDTIKMASVSWFLKFRSRHPSLKKTLTKKLEHCICITGCHMGPEGKQALKELEAEVLVARVYHYLKKELEYITMNNDLSLLMNILRRTAEATGVCEQTITKILEEEEQNRLELNDVSAQSKSDTSDDVPVVAKKKKIGGTEENNYNCSTESSNVETVDEDSSSSNNVPRSDFERLQQDAASIKSVVVEILDEDFNEKYLPRDTEDTAMRIDSTDLKYSNPETCPTQDQTVVTNADHLALIDPRSDDPTSIEDEGELVIDESGMIDVSNENNITRFHADNELTTKDLPRDAEDTSIRIDSPGLKYSKPLILRDGNPANAHTIPSKKPVPQDT